MAIALTPKQIERLKLSVRPRVYDLILVLVGALTALLGTILTELYLIPTKEYKLHQQQLVENKLSKLYTPLILATVEGQFSMTGDMIFYKVKEIMVEYGYLADQEVMDKYIEFVRLCSFAGYDDLKKGSLFSEPLPNDVIFEVVRQRRLPLKWDADSLDKAIQVEKEFNQILLKYYKKARKTFSIGSE